MVTVWHSEVMRSTERTSVLQATTTTIPEYVSTDEKVRSYALAETGFRENNFDR